MAQVRFQVALKTATQLARDDIVNTFYLDTDPVLGGGPTDYQQLADDAAELFATYRVYPQGWPLLQVKAYDMSDAKPREPRAVATAVPTPGSAGAPQEVALCLSYYADRNLPRLRGRMYIGPWRTTNMNTRPDQLNMDDLVNLAVGIGDLGGVNVQWVQHSPTTGQYHTVTDYWIDDEWDTVRSRGLQPTRRTVGSLDG